MICFKSKIILLFIFIYNIQTIGLNVSLITKSNAYKIKQTNYQNLWVGPGEHDYYSYENGDYYDGKFVDGLANDDHGEYYFAIKIAFIMENLKMEKQKEKVYMLNHINPSSFSYIKENLEMEIS